MTPPERARRTGIEWAEDAIRVLAIAVSCSIAALAASDRLGADEPGRATSEEPAELVAEPDWVDVLELEPVQVGTWHQQAGVSLAVLSVEVDPDEQVVDSFGETQHPSRGNQFVVVRFGMHNRTDEVIRDFCVAGIELLDDHGRVHTVSDASVAGNIHCLMGLRPGVRHVDRIVFEIDDGRAPARVSFWNPAEDTWGSGQRFDVRVGG